MVERIPKDAYRAAGFDLARGVDPKVADDIGHPVPPHLLEEALQPEDTENAVRYELEDPELNEIWQQRNAREHNAASSIGEVTIAEAQRNAAKNSARHNAVRGEERQAARRPLGEK